MDATILVEVENNDIPGKVSIIIRGVSWDGKELLSHTFFLEPLDRNEIKRFTDTRPFKAEEFLKVRDWEVKSVSKYKL